MKQETERDGSTCVGVREDYFECLHHRKEHQRLRIISAQDKMNKAGATTTHGGDH